MYDRAVNAAREQFRATDRATVLARQLQTPMERMREAVAEARELFRDDAKNLARAVKAARDRFKDETEKKDPDADRIKNIREAIKTDVQRAAEQIADTLRLVKDQKLTADEGKLYIKKLKEGFLKETFDAFAEADRIKGLATRSSSIARNIGAFAPTFDNTKSEEKAFRDKQIELQDATRKAAEKLARKNPILI